MQNGNVLTNTNIVIGVCAFQADGWQVTASKTADIMISYFVVLKATQCLYAEKAYFGKTLSSITYDIPIDQTLTVQLPEMFIFPSCGGFTADSL